MSNNEPADSKTLAPRYLDPITGGISSHAPHPGAIFAQYRFRDPEGNAADYFVIGPDSDYPTLAECPDWWTLYVNGEPTWLFEAFEPNANSSVTGFGFRNSDRSEPIFNDIETAANAILRTYYLEVYRAEQKLAPPAWSLSGDFKYTVTHNSEQPAPEGTIQETKADSTSDDSLPAMSEANPPPDRWLERATGAILIGHPNEARNPEEFAKAEFRWRDDTADVASHHFGCLDATTNRQLQWWMLFIDGVPQDVLEVREGEFAFRIVDIADVKSRDLDLVVNELIRVTYLLTSSDQHVTWTPSGSSRANNRTNIVGVDGLPAHVMAKFDQAVHDAGEAFWAAIVAAYPEVKTGDFGPEETFAWEAARDKAIATWLYWNHPDVSHD